MFIICFVLVLMPFLPTCMKTAAPSIISKFELTNRYVINFGMKHKKIYFFVLIEIEKKDLELFCSEVSIWSI